MADLWGEGVGQPNDRDLGLEVRYDGSDPCSGLRPAKQVRSPRQCPVRASPRYSQRPPNGGASHNVFVSVSASHQSSNSLYYP